MNSLLQCPHDTVSHECFVYGKHPPPRKTEKVQSLHITSNSPLMCFALDSSGIQWPREPHPDAVVIGSVGGRSVVCFIELKGNTENLEKAFQQIENGVLHFCDGELDSLGRPEGTKHHDEWRGHDDIEGLEIDGQHAVVGVFVPRGRVSPRKPKVLNTKKKVARIGVAFVARGPRNRQEIEFERLVGQFISPNVG